MRQTILALALGTLLLAGAGPATGPSLANRDLEELHQRNLDELLQRVQALEYKLAGKNAERDSLAQTIAQVREHIREASGLVAVTPDDVRAALVKLQERRDQLELDAAGDGGRRAGIEQAIDKLTSEAARKAQSDEVVEQLAKVAAIRDKQIQRLREMQEKHAVSPGDVDAAEAEAALAHAKLAEAKQHAIGSGAREALDGWNRELLKLSIDEQERKARLEFIAKRLSSMSSVDKLLDGLEQGQTRLARLAGEIDQLRGASQSAREAYESYKIRGAQPPAGSGQ